MEIQERNPQEKNGDLGCSKDQKFTVTKTENIQSRNFSWRPLEFQDGGGFTVCKKMLKRFPTKKGEFS